MKRPSASAKELSLARKRALIRALIEQTTAAAQGTAPTPPPARIENAPGSNIIPFPTASK